MRLNFIMPLADKTFMNSEFIDTLIELCNKVPRDDAQFALLRMGVLVELEMRDMESKGITITRDSMLEAFKIALEKHRQTEKLEKKSKTA
jgi:hypothetical protein